ncbi:MAG TPA: DUF2461 domain-containing protein [Bryobacteraceae bacterium]|jgi:uncharacterized protein (TIGR02453 family)
MPAFAGFSEDAVKFFRTLRKNNTREWFQPRKDIFDSSIRAVMEDLVGHINHEFGKFAPLHIAEPKKAIYRIYRDTRFSNDKTPYKTHIAANFPRQGMEKHSAAGYYFSVSDEEVEFAGGVYMPLPDGLLALRNHIVENDARFARIVAHKKLVESMGPLYGGSLTRVPKGFDANHASADFIRMKQWMFFKAIKGPAMMRSPDLLKEVVMRFKLVAPLVVFLNEPLERVLRRASSAGRLV